MWTSVLIIFCLNRGRINLSYASLLPLLARFLPVCYCDKTMLSLRDFFHLPQVDPIIDQLTHDVPGLVIVAGMDSRLHADPASFTPSGRGGIFRILVRQILESNAGLKATVVAMKRGFFRVPRNLYRRVGFEIVRSPQDYTECIRAVTQLQTGLVVVDQFIPENAGVILEAAQSGCRLISQMDTIFRGEELLRALLEWGIPRGRFGGLQWVVAMQRIPMLCECKVPVLPEDDLIDAIQRRYPTLEIDPESTYYVPGSCGNCGHTGRRNEITAFDFFRADPGDSFTQPSLLPLEAYMLGLAQHGHIPLSDLLRIEKDQLHRTYQILSASERVLADTRTTLERKVVELEAANRVLRNRTQELVSLQEIGQTLIGTSTLRDLARQVCHQASTLCGADRTIFYFLRDEDNAEVLATHGWAPGRVPQRVQAHLICDPDAGPTPGIFNGWPPGVESRHPDVEGAKLRAGLRVPLVAQGKPVGAMIVHATTRSRFLPGAIALLQTFANQAAIAIQRAGLIESLQEKIDQLEAAQEGLAKKERMERELELAREVQQAVLPHTFPEIPGYRFAAQNRPARQVGGDFFDVIDLGENRFGLVVADVSDKGMPAAVYMALTRSVMVAEARRAVSPKAVLQNVHQLLQELGRARMFVTVFYGVVDGPSCQLTYARAGHDRPLLIRDNQVFELPGEGVFLGYHESAELGLTEETLALKPGDRLVLYTDGLTDTVSPKGRRFDRKGLYNLLRNTGEINVNELATTIFDAVTSYQGDMEQFDDMTLLLVEVTTSKSEPELLRENSEIDPI
jgi:sigma-B regulation protein RsbU (phosphoserine phosphatase)